jgi:hypothetical protein
MNDPIPPGRPRNVDFQHHGDHIEIVRRWFTGTILFMTFFLVFWDGFLIVWYQLLPPQAPAFARYFPLLHVVIGIGFTYWVIAGWFNRTRILVGQGALSVRHGPIPWFGQHQLDTMTIRQLYAKEHTRWNDGSKTVTYEVHVITRDNRDIKILSGLETSEAALFIEHEVERYLRIEDAPVKGAINVDRGGSA